MTNNYSIHTWMLTQLGLSYAALLVYAMVYSYTVGAPDRCYHGSVMTLVRCTGCCRTTVIDTLARLVADGLLARREVRRGKVRYVAYTALVGVDGQSPYRSGQRSTADGHNNNRGPDGGPHNTVTDPAIGSDVTADACTQVPRAAVNNEEVGEYVCP